jgi:hypothetical protein
MVAGVSAVRRRPPPRGRVKSVPIGHSLDERAPRSLASSAASGNKGTHVLTLEKLEVQGWWSGSIAGISHAEKPTRTSFLSWGVWQEGVFI